MHDKPHSDHHDHDHDHGHGDPHEPPHAHPHEHEHEHAGVARDLLAEGAGRGKTLFFDCFSGIAGDMTIAALLDLGVPLLAIERAVAALPIEGFHLHRGHAHRSGIVATSFDVHVEAAQPERTYASIERMLVDAPLEPPVKELARRIFRRLGEAEAAVHRMPLDDVHFHEVGAVDAIVDVVGAAAAITYLGAEVVASPLPMGRGFVKARHGVLPLPAPATVECLRGVPTYGVDLEAELVTPTGAAIVATVAQRFERWPSFSPERVGFGAGQRELPGRPNLVRAVLGARSSGLAGEAEGAWGGASHVILEANVDDLTGEIAAHALDALFAAGAVDAWAIPITMKKGRPALTISALAPAPQADAVATALLRETTSIGLRRIPVTRTERPRRSLTVETSYGPIRVKVSEGPFGPPQVKPEFDDCATAARTHGVPVREVIAAALAAFR
jgi:pyridinium-3,5-bisthiocarboxylic acid mononucleotide nickel chelatase